MKLVSQSVSKGVFQKVLRAWITGVKVSSTRILCIRVFTAIFSHMIGRTAVVRHHRDSWEREDAGKAGEVYEEGLGGLAGACA